MEFKNRPITVFLYVVFFILLTISFLRVHSRIQITLLGYEIGRMKEREAELIKTRGLLTMELSKISTKNHLLALISKSHGEKSKNDASEYAKK